MTVIVQESRSLAEQAGAGVGASLDLGRTAEELLDAVTGGLADAGAVDLLDAVIGPAGPGQPRQAGGGGTLRLRRLAARWPAGCPAPPGYLDREWAEADPDRQHRRRLAAGAPVLVPAFEATTPGELRAVASAWADRMLAARAAGAHSSMIIPLAARGAVMGMVVLDRLAGSPPFTRADLALARDIVSRAAVSVDNARLYTRERAAARELQHGLLPRPIPEVPGLELAGRYVPARADAVVGGDWFDVVALPGGRAALAVGDVTGHDLRAAAVMGQLRTATRTLASLDLPPSELLARLDHVAADLTDDETCATCIYAVHDPAARQWQVASAGHPPPAVARPGRPASFLDLPPGPPLGAVGAGRGDYPAAWARLPDRSTLVLYTDGLIEDRAAGIGTGMTRLSRALQAASQLSVARACDTLLTSLAACPADDITILMARTRCP